MPRDHAGHNGTDAQSSRARTRPIMVAGAALAMVALLATIAPAAAGAQEAPDRPESAQCFPGAPGIGDPYFPMDGNGGYNVAHYGLELSYDPGTDILDGVATIDLRATQNLSRFNFDLDGLTVRSITVDGSPATFARRNGELKVRPPACIPANEHAAVVVTYDGNPSALPAEDGAGGFIASDDGAVVIGQPHVASTWFPANDHPRDKAAFDIAVTVPDGLEVVSNGSLTSHDSAAGETRWVWHAPAPMAPYLATIAIGEFDLAEYHDEGGRPGGIDYVDAIDPDLLTPVAPHTGSQYAVSQAGNQTYKRLRRTITVPPAGADMSFWINRDTEPSWDYVFVEARTVGQRNWTTLPDANGHTDEETGASCPFWLDLHPFLTHYQTDVGDGSCATTGTTGDWHAVSGFSEGWEQWSVDLGAFAGTDAQVSITYASDDTVQGPGVAVDDIAVSTGEGSTSFEDDADVLDGWTVPGAPASSADNENDWIIGTVDDGPTPHGVNVQAALDRQPEIISFLADNFGDYPFADSGAIVDDVRDLGFALENQTRPVYDRAFFDGTPAGDFVVVHELTHQWFGDRLALPAWKHIWLNEGFATYAEWLWSEHEGLDTAQQIFDNIFGGIPADNDFWALQIGDPGPDFLFDGPVYLRGAMTLHALRLEVGDTDFFDILRRWASAPRGRTATTRNFIALAERVSGQELSPLFHEWLHTTDKPALTAAAAAAVGTPSEAAPSVPERRGPARR